MASPAGKEDSEDPPGTPQASQGAAKCLYCKALIGTGLQHPGIDSVAIPGQHLVKQMCPTYYHRPPLEKNRQLSPFSGKALGSGGLTKESAGKAWEANAVSSCVSSHAPLTHFTSRIPQAHSCLRVSTLALPDAGRSFP